MVPKYSRAGLACMGVPLYAGPVLAGWSAAPFTVFVLLIAVFFAMQVMRGLLPRDAPVAQIGLLLGVQAVVVAVAWGIGAVGALATGALTLPPWLPVVASLTGAAVGVARYRKTAESAEMDRLIGDALNAMETGKPSDFDANRAPTEEDMRRHSAVSDAVNDVVEALWQLPDGVDYHQLDLIVQALETQVDHHGYDGLLSEVQEGFANVDRAMLRYLASARVRHALTGAGAFEFLHDLILDSTDPATLGEYCGFVETLLDEDAPTDDLPDLQRLRQAAGHCPDLATTARRLESRLSGAHAASDRAG